MIEMKTSHYLPRIIFVSALQEELDPLWAHPDLSWLEPQEEGDAIWYRQCIYDGYELVSACAGEMGLTATTILTTKLILRWQPILVVMIGICGGRKDYGLDLGDVIFSDASIHYQFGKLTSGSFEVEKRRAEANKDVLELAQEFIKEDLQKQFVKNFSETSPRNTKKIDGTYASSDLVVKDEKKILEARSAADEIIALDMESYAVMQTALDLQVPFGGLVIKSVSDYANKQKSKKHRDCVKLQSARTAIAFLTNSFIPWHKGNYSAEELCSLNSVSSLILPLEHPSILLVADNEKTFNLLKQAEFDSIQFKEEKLFGEPLLSFQLGDTHIFASSLKKGCYGLVDGAIWATLLMTYLRPTLGIIFGTCGGFSRRTEIGDLIIANRAFHYQFGAFKQGDMQGELRSVDINDHLKSFLFAISASKFDSTINKAYKSSTFKLDKQKPYKTPKWHIQPVASSDLFVKDKKKIEDVVARDRKTLAVDMEGYAFMRAAINCDVPLGGLIIRTVADHADNADGQTLIEYARYSSTSFVLDLLLSLDKVLFHSRRVFPI